MSASVIRRILVNKNFRNFGAARGLADGVGEKNVLTCPTQIEIPNQTIHEYMYSKIEKYSKFTAFECSITGKNYNYDQVRVKARNLSKALRKKLKLDTGDVVAILLPNVPEFFVSALGILEAGLVITTLNPLYTPDEISRQLIDSSAKLVITLNDLYPSAKKSVELVKRQLPIVTINMRPDQSTPEGALKFDELVNTNIDMPDIQPGNPEDLALLPYSSGTTGLPKGVQLNHKNILSNIYQMTAPGFKIPIDATESHQDLTPAVLPMFHIYGFTTGLVMMNSGSKVVTLPKFTPELYISVLERYSVTSILAAPPLVLFLTNHPLVKAEYLKKVRVVNSGAAPLGALDEQRFKEKAGNDVFVSQGYGLTETSPVVAMTTKKMRAECKNSGGSIGVAVPSTQLKIIGIDDPTGTPLGPNQNGELLVKGPQVMQGYHNRPEETKQAFLDGWLRTGDLMQYNEDGILFVTDRLKELIKVKGFQVAPAELEEILRNFPTVADAGVIGVPHPTQGEVPRAYVVPKPGQTVETKELEAFVAQKVAQYKQLKGGVEVVEQIPKNSAGKILRRQLKLQYEKTH